MSAGRRLRPSGPDTGPQHVGRAMAKVLGRLGAPQSLDTMEVIFTRWPEVVGPELAGHLQPVRVHGNVLVISADLSALAATDRDLGRYTITGGASIYPFVWSILLAAHDRGLGGVMTTVATRKEHEVRTLLALGARAGRQTGRYYAVPRAGAGPPIGRYTPGRLRVA